jgi:hypothetical protein
VFLDILVAYESSSEYSSDSEESREEVPRRKDEHKWQDAAIAASWSAYVEFRHQNQITEMLTLTLRLKKDLAVAIGDSNWLRLVPKCEDPCIFREKECDHRWKEVALDKVGDYVLFSIKMVSPWILPYQI